MGDDILHIKDKIKTAVDEDPDAFDFYKDLDYINVNEEYIAAILDRKKSNQTAKEENTQT